MINFKDKKIAVLGLGIEGVSSSLFLAGRRAKVTVLDQKQESDLGSGFADKVKKAGVSVGCGKDVFHGLAKFDVIVRSPGVKRSLSEIKEAEKKGVLITSQTQLFFDLCPCKIIGVTGTKGKGTTSSLIYEMLKREGKDAYLGGNIGNPPFDFLDKLTSQSFVVLEMSSFQLLDLSKSPHIAVMLMTTSEHLDYHKDIYEYVEAKRNILRFQNSTDFAIVNRDYPASRKSDVETNGKIYQVSKENGVAQGCFVRDGKIIVCMRAEEEVIDIKDVLLPGRHNLENVCAAVMAAVLIGVSKTSIVSVLKTFKGLEHRLELVGEVRGVKYYDDSFSTTPETAIAAIQVFGAPEILILGGSSKNSDFNELGRVICGSKNIKAIIGIGKEWTEIRSKIKDQPRLDRGQRSKIVEGCKNMKEIVQTVHDIAQPGDVVLLSPACASFDMFRNYKDRGEQFKREVEKLRKTSMENLHKGSNI